MEGLSRCIRLTKKHETHPRKSGDFRGTGFRCI